MLKTLLIILAAALLAVFVALSLVLLSPGRSVIAIEWTVDTLTDLNIEFVKPSINVFERTASAEEIHFYQRGTGGPALISITVSES